MKVRPSDVTASIQFLCGKVPTFEMIEGGASWIAWAVDRLNRLWVTFSESEDGGVHLYQVSDGEALSVAVQLVGPGERADFIAERIRLLSKDHVE